MLSLVRTGPTIITISAKEYPGELIDAIESIASSRLTSPLESYNNVGEGDTLIFFSSECSDEVQTYQTTTRTSTILCGIINRNLTDKIHRIRVTPPNIVMRLIDDFDRAIDQIAIDFKAREAMREYLMQNLDERSVLLNFTSEPLNKVVTVKDLRSVLWVRRLRASLVLTHFTPSISLRDAGFTRALGARAGSSSAQ